MIEPGGYVVSALMALGIALAFFRADPRSGTSRALSLALALTGCSIFARLGVIGAEGTPAVDNWARLNVLLGSGAFISAFAWTSRVRKTIPAGELRTRFGDVAILISQALIFFYGACVLWDPSVWVQEFLPGIENRDAWSRQTWLGFAMPISVAMILWTASMLLCLNRRPDPAERVRLVAVLFACPLIAAGLILPQHLTPIATTFGMIILLIGAMRYAELRGRRGLFMSRFLSPQVADLVNRSGLNAAMREARQNISVLCCDLRGFTAYASANTSDQVLTLLNAYYDIVGAEVVKVEGTIKDYAGDGILILLGAPVAMDDHAERAVVLAEQIRRAVSEVIEATRQTTCPLGIGIGIASGEVTVGIIGGEGRLEYAAVGSAVNLASRLCEQAADGEILLDDDTVTALEASPSTDKLQAKAPLTLKGFAEPVLSFSLSKP